MAQRILVFNDELPPALARALKRAAKNTGVTMNDYACMVIATRYGISFGMKSNYQEPTTSRFRLRVPLDIREALAIDAAEQGATIRGIALNILASHFGTKPVETHRRPRSQA